MYFSSNASPYVTSGIVNLNVRKLAYDDSFYHKP